MSDHGQHDSPEEMFEPDGASATALFFILGFMAVGLALCVIFIWQWFATAARAEKMEKGSAEYNELVALETDSEWVQENWGFAGCPAETAPAAGEDDGGDSEDTEAKEEEPDPGKPPCSYEEMTYHSPIDEAVSEIVTSSDPLAPGPPPPSPSDSANSQQGTQGAPANQGRRQIKKVPSQPQRMKIAPGQGNPNRRRDIQVQPKRRPPTGAGQPTTP